MALATQPGRLYAVIWERWWTASTEHTCATCAALHGSLFRRGEGPQPPIHLNCHCKRRYDHTEIVHLDPDVGRHP